MSGGSEGGLGREIILALVVEEPGSTAWELELRLRNRFPTYGYSRSIVRRTLGRLRAGKLVEESPRTRGARRREVGEWTATPEGVERSRAWLQGDLVDAPVRDDLNARMAFSTPADVPRLLKVIVSAEAQCIERIEAIRLARGNAASNRVVEVAIAAELEQAQLRLGWLQRIKARLQDAQSSSPERSKES